MIVYDVLLLWCGTLRVFCFCHRTLLVFLNLSSNIVHLRLPMTLERKKFHLCSFVGQYDCGMVHYYRGMPLAIADQWAHNPSHSMFPPSPYFHLHRIDSLLTLCQGPWVCLETESLKLGILDDAEAHLYFWNW
jgi:hypothetical protein